MLTRAHVYVLDAFEPGNPGGKLLRDTVRWGESAVSRVSPVFADAAKRLALELSAVVDELF